MAQVTVYISGSIAAYKGVEVVRGLQKAGHQVKAVMTASATKLIGPATLAALTKAPVLTDLWHNQARNPIPHIELADWTQLAVVVPASADIIAKMANGIADDAASTTLLATGAPKVVVPAMNSHMWGAPATQRNLALLRQDGVTVIEPATGRLAEDYAGKGRLPEPAMIVDRALALLTKHQTLAGKTVLVTAGGTREPLDPVRYIGNRSSGKMGIALAKAFASAGARVELIVGQVSVPLPTAPNIEVITALTTEQMATAVRRRFPNAAALVMAAAVADYRPVELADHKLKKVAGQSTRTIKLTETEDILKEVAGHKQAGQVVVGFAAETNDLLANAQKKLANKQADLIVANQVGGVKSAFGSENDQVTILAPNQAPQQWPEMTKEAVAKRLVAQIAKMIK